MCVLDNQCTLPKLRCALKFAPKNDTGDGVFSNLETSSIGFLLPFKEITYLPHFKGKDTSCKNSWFSAVAVTGSQ